MTTNPATTTTTTSRRSRRRRRRKKQQEAEEAPHYADYPRRQQQQLPLVVLLVLWLSLWRRTTIARADAAGEALLGLMAREQPAQQHRWPFPYSLFTMRLVGVIFQGEGIKKHDDHHNTSKINSKNNTGKK